MKRYGKWWAPLVLMGCLSTGVPRMPYRPRAIPIRDSVAVALAYEAPLDLARRLMREPLLRAVELPAGVRELGMSESYSMFLGGVVQFLTVQIHARDTTGTVGLLQGCKQPSTLENFRWCVITASEVAGVRWGEVARTLDSLGVWRFRQTCEDGRLMSDSGNLEVQRLDGPAYTEYHCNTPWARQGPNGDPPRRAHEYLLDLVCRAGSRLAAGCVPRPGRRGAESTRGALAPAAAVPPNNTLHPAGAPAVPVPSPAPWW